MRRPARTAASEAPKTAVLVALDGGRAGLRMRQEAIETPVKLLVPLDASTTNDPSRLRPAFSAGLRLAQ